MKQLDHIYDPLPAGSVGLDINVAVYADPTNVDAAIPASQLGASALFPRSKNKRNLEGTGREEKT
jgi:hypothetical protein